MNTDSILYQFIRPLAPQWFADRYRAQHVAAMRSVMDIYAVVSKIGVTNVGSNRTGYGAFLQTIKDAGRKLGVVVCYDDFGAAFEAKQYWPEVLTVGMFTDTDFGFDYAEFVRRAKLNPWIDYWAIYNEIGGQNAATYARMADDYIAFMPRMAGDGLRLGMFSTASGTPPLPSEDGGACYDQIARACKYAVDNHHDALLLVHEYESIGTLGRYTYLRDHLIERNAILPIVVSEWGNETFHGVDHLIGLIRNADPIYMVDQWVESCGNWAIGGGGWAGSNWSSAFPQVGEYIATVPPVDPIDPPPAEEWIVDDVKIDGVSIGVQLSGVVVMNGAHKLELFQRPKPVTHSLTVVETPIGGYRFEPRSGQHAHGSIVEWQIVKA